MDDIKPSQMLHIGGGALILICTFLDWFGNSSGWDTDGFGLLGILYAAIGAVLVGGGLMAATGNDANLPDEVLSLNRDQLHLMLGFTVFISLFGLQFSTFSEIGITLGWIGGALVVASAVMEINNDSGSSAPTQF